MTPPPEPPPSAVTRFRTKLLVAMMLVVSASTALALYFAERNAAADVERGLQREFQGELAALHHVQEIRHAALVERCRALVGKPRIHAALEDNALDLLYPSAQDELRDVMAPAGEAAAEESATALHAEFYRFLDRTGALIAPPNARAVGALRPEEEAQLALPGLSDRQQLGYLVRRTGDGREAMAEVIAMPIVSSENGEVIAAIVLGFKPVVLGGLRMDSGIRRGVWLGGRLHLSALSAAEQAALGGEIRRAIAAGGLAENSFGREVAGAPHLFFY